MSIYQEISWSGVMDGERWKLTVEHDRFSADEPSVVVVWTDHEDKVDGEVMAGAFLSPEQARQAAAALLSCAHMAERDNARRCNPTATQMSPAA